MVRVRAPCGKVAFALYVLFGIVDAFEFCMVYWASLTLFRFVKFTEHPWRTHATAKGDGLFPSPLGKIDCRAGGDAFFSSSSGLSMQSPKDAYLGISHAF